MFDPVDYEKKERMDKTIDDIRKRYGNDAVMRAYFWGTAIDQAGQRLPFVHRCVDGLEAGINKKQ